MNALLNWLRATWRSLVAAFERDPPPGLVPTQPADTEIMAPPPARPPVVSTAGPT